MNNSQTSIQHVLDTSSKDLQSAGIETARLDCLVLMEDVLKKDRSWILAHQEHAIPDKQLKRLNSMITQRTAHTPLAYIRGKTEFYGRQFVVSPSVLVPRPESESLIQLLKHLNPPAQTLIDIGTGSGCLAVTAKLELPNLHIHATDTSPEALTIATINAQQHNVNITFHPTYLLSAELHHIANGQPYGVITNLPYVPDDYPVNKAAQHEPSSALFAGRDGLDLYRELFAQIRTATNKPEYIITESLPSQHHSLTSIAAQAGYKSQNAADFGQCFTRD